MGGSTAAVSRDALRSDVSRLLSPIVNDKALARHAPSLYAEPAFREALERTGRNVVLERFTPEQVRRK